MRAAIVPAHPERHSFKAALAGTYRSAFGTAGQIRDGEPQPTIRQFSDMIL